MHRAVGFSATDTSADVHTDKHRKVEKQTRRHKQLDAHVRMHAKTLTSTHTHTHACIHLTHAVQLARNAELECSTRVTSVRVVELCRGIPPLRRCRSPTGRSRSHPASAGRPGIRRPRRGQRPRHRSNSPGCGPRARRSPRSGRPARPRAWRARRTARPGS